ncbi:acyl carrier protein (plasmid) [Burkholderia cenocepacia]|uniref:acyl carrier protein n=1 Tax=Burkholderia cenocepacia TaxID=95486 RepID=UPI001F453674|nr:acyl carrier protein [Burkholderia cenocepacia]UJH78488.1 acyl carrier protein [Burkholderia cenocepacia]
MQPVTDHEPADQTRTALESQIISALAGILDCDTETLSPIGRFDELGLDSLTSFRFAARLEEQLGTAIDVEWLYDYPTPGDLAAFLCTQC